MEDLIINATKATPQVHLSAQTGVLEISGESYPENSVAFFTPIFEWVESFIAEEKGRAIRLILDISYFNSSSSKVLLDLFDLLAQAVEDGCDAAVEWRYHADNDMAKEYGEEFKEDVEGIELRLVEIGEES